MLYFSKIKLFVIYFIIIILSLCSLLNFTDNKDNLILSKKINLGLDLQGGSYLLLEVDVEPIINQKLQQKLLNFRKYLKSNKIKYQNLKLENQSINFSINDLDLEKFEKYFLDKNNPINVYYNQVRSYEMEYTFKDNNVKIEYSKFGLIEIKNSTLNQSIEIVRRRIDEVGTNDPTIVRRGNDRILVELPGLENPNRVKKLLGKTANLTFRLVSETEDTFGTEFLTFENSEVQLNISKRVILTGDNLINARPILENQTNEPVVSFTFDRMGAKKFGMATTNNVGKKLAIILDNKIISAPIIPSTLYL